MSLEIMVGSSHFDGAEEAESPEGRCVRRWRRQTVRVDSVTPVEVVCGRLRAAHVGLLLGRAIDEVMAVAEAELVGLDEESLSEWAEGVECLRRTVEAASVGVAQRLEVENPFRRVGFFSSRSWLMHRLQLSGPEAYRRVQVARMAARLAAWSTAMDAGEVGVAQVELMARVAANPRLSDEVLVRDQQLLLDDACRLPFVEFERALRTWEALADPAGDAARAQRQAASRSLRLRPRPTGGWTVSGSLDELAGAELVEVLAHFEDAQWRTDWAEARGRLGDDATTADLVRTADQRRADALVAMACAAATTTPGLRNGPTVNVLIDEHSFHAALVGDRIEPVNYRTVVCRTQAGRRLHRDDAVNAALVGHIRRVVIDTAGVVIDLGHRARLFRGRARDAVLVTSTTCIWFGCDQPVQWCQTDHSTAWRAHGPTVPRNGAPMCQRHQLHKEHGFHVHRDHHGTWHITDPNGQPVT